jgi:hypothetical protein
MLLFAHYIEVDSKQSAHARMYSAIQSCICILVTDPDHGRDGLGMFLHDKCRAGAKSCGHLEGANLDSFAFHSLLWNRGAFSV